METRRRRGSREPLETAAPESVPILEPEAVIPEEIAPPAPEAPAAEDHDAASDDSLTALARAEEALTHIPEVSGAPAPEEPAAPPADDLCALGRDSLAALAEAQAALVRGYEAVGSEIVGLARSGLDTASRMAAGLLAVRTLSDAVALQADCARSSLDAALCGSARLSQLGVRLAAEAAEPLVAQFGRNWLRAARRAG
jgi:hypothetical protein